MEDKKTTDEEVIRRTITIDGKTWKELRKIKYETEATSYDAVIKELISKAKIKKA